MLVIIIKINEFKVKIKFIKWVDLNNLFMKN